MKNKENNLNKEDVQKKERSKKWIIIILLAIIILLLLKLCMPCAPNGFEQPTTPTINNNAPAIDSNAGVYVEPETAPPSKGVAIPGWGKIVIPANQKEDIPVDFFNPEDNEGLYYLTFEIRLLNDSEQGYEVLYTSGLIEPGLHIQKISLTRALEAGEYDAVIHVQPYRMSNKSTTNNADMKTKLIVK